MTEWMREVRKALETIPKDTPNRLKAAMAKAKLTYKKGSASSSHNATSSHSMKKSHKRGRSHKRSGKSRKGMRKSKGKKSRRQHYKGGATSRLNPADYNSGKSVDVEKDSAVTST